MYSTNTAVQQAGRCCSHAVTLQAVSAAGQLTLPARCVKACNHAYAAMERSTDLLTSYFISWGRIQCLTSECNVLQQHRDRHSPFMALCTVMFSPS